MSQIVGAWTLYFAWNEQTYHSAPITFNQNGTTSDGAHWSLSDNQISWAYDNSENVYSGVIEGYAMVGTMSGFGSGWFYAVKNDIPRAATADLAQADRGSQVSP